MGSFTKVNLKNFLLLRLMRIIKHIVSERKTRARYYLMKNGQNKSVSNMECFNFFMMGLHSFDRANSIEVDNSVGDDCKSSKKSKRS